MELPATENNARSLLIMSALLVGVHDPGNLPGFVVCDCQSATFGTHLKVARRLTFGNFGIQRRHFALTEFPDYRTRPESSQGARRADAN
jgi:hypothetical protein